MFTPSSNPVEEFLHMLQQNIEHIFCTSTVQELIFDQNEEIIIVPHQHAAVIENQFVKHIQHTT